MPTVKVLYKNYCNLCHGNDGNEQMAEVMEDLSPVNLTLSTITIYICRKLWARVERPWGVSRECRDGFIVD